MARSVVKAVNSIHVLIPWRAAVLVGTLCVVCLLLFYNLEHSPSSWSDEGFYLSVSRTIAEDGVYAARNSDGYQTYGVTQSIGPTVILPIAMSFKLFGVGLLQARVLIALFGLIVLALVYCAARALFATRVAALAVLLLLGSGTSFLYASRLTMGEVPALGFFLGGWLAWTHAVRTRRSQLHLLAGLLIGLAMITKAQYLVIGFVTLAMLGALDLLYYKQGYAKALMVVGAMAGACVVAWLCWQIAYFGPATFWADTNKARQLASSTTGFHLQWAIEALQYLFGPASDHFYFFWGLPALAYAGILCTRRNRESLILAFLVIFTVLWLGSFVFWTRPWWRYALTPIFVSSIFVAKLWHDLMAGFRLSWNNLGAELRQRQPGRATLTLAALAVLALMVGEPIQKAVRLNVLARDDAQRQVALYLDTQIAEGKTIETWEREIAILSDQRYHFPEQEQVLMNMAAYPNPAERYVLGASYFKQHQVAYLVVGKTARSPAVYDMQYLARAACLLATIGEGEDRYDIYSLQQVPRPSADPDLKRIAACP